MLKSLHKGISMAITVIILSILLTSFFLTEASAFDGRIISDMNQMRSEATIIELKGDSYLDMSCVGDQEIKSLCDDVEAQAGVKPIIHSSEEAYCAYAVLENKGYHCIDSNLTSITTYIFPGGEGYCDGTTFSCPKETGVPPRSLGNEIEINQSELVLILGAIIIFSLYVFFLKRKKKAAESGKSWSKRKKIIIFIIIFFVVLPGIVFAFLISLSGARKPAIYLYPTEDSQIDVQLKINGFMTKDIPDYNKGWNVFATKEGLIEGGYDYLFYEALLRKVELPETGWVVEYGDLEQWFEVNLKELGLNEKEKDQFMEYWVEELPKANYYEIKLLEEQYLNENMALIISPQPETVIRLMFNFRPLKEKINLPEPNIIVPERKGFTVVEWGGILDK